jgi:2-polyprenyl-3-methyl-5-hydroxy-6-metoxy-1,4-benzoquinol methylase
MDDARVTNKTLKSLGRWLHDMRLPHPLKVPMDEKQRRRIWQRRDHILPPILLQYPEGLNGLTVCDLGANAGFWAREFASLGAKVTCVEPRAQNIKQAEVISKILGKQGLYWVQDTAESFLKNDQNQYDVVLLLGLLYHVANPIELLHLATNHAKDILMLDSHCINDDIPYFELRKELNERQTQGIAEKILMPSRGAIYWMLKDCNYRSITELLNVGSLPDDYLSFIRCTFLMRRYEPIVKPEKGKKLFFHADELRAIYPPLQPASKLIRTHSRPRMRDFYEKWR